MTAPTPPPPPVNPRIPRGGAPVSGPARTQCSRCPSYMETDQEIRAALGGVHTGAAHCRRFLVPLGMPNGPKAEESPGQVAGDAGLRLQQVIGARCGFHGDRLPDDFRYHPAQGADVAAPALFATIAADDDPSGPDYNGGASIADARPGSCSGCTWFVPGERVREITELFDLPVCGYHGKFLPLGQFRLISSTCGAGITDFDNSLGSTRGLVLSDYYEGWYTLSVSAAPPVSVDATPIHPDPASVVTEREVAEADAKIGIRAWQRIPGADRRSAWLPIFDRDHFDAEARALIPQAGGRPDEPHPELYDDHRNLAYELTSVWRQLHGTVAVNGVTGTGKTELGRFMAYRTGLPFVHISIDASSQVDDLAGRTVFADGETRFVYGRIPRWISRPCVLLIDEPNTGPNDVWQFLRSLLDDSRRITLDVASGETIHRHPHCYIMLAFNPSWNILNVGTREIGDADASRLHHIEMPRPDERRERMILQRYCALAEYEIPEDTLNKIMGIANEIRTLADSGAFPINWGTRHMKTVALATSAFSIPKSFLLAGGDFISPMHREQLMQQVNSHI